MPFHPGEDMLCHAGLQLRKLQGHIGCDGSYADENQKAIGCDGSYADENQKAG